jgi:hypothetical protein
MSRRSTAFSLVELLVAMALGLAIAGVIAAVVMHLHRLSARTIVRLALHDDAAVLARVLDRQTQASHPSGLWMLESSRGADGAWGTGDEWVALTFLVTKTLGDKRYDGTTVALPENHWFRLRWDAAVPPAAGLLRASAGAANSSDIHSVRTPNPTAISLSNQPLPRRDRRRSLDDNDLRLIPGISAALYTSLAMKGDGQRLDAYLVPVLSPVSSVDDLQLDWTDRAGRRVLWTAATGVEVRDVSGNLLSPPANATWWTDERLVCDGDFLDARDYRQPATASPAVVADTLSVGAQRPLVLRLACTLSEAAPADAPLSRGRDLIQEFSFAFPLGPEIFTK